MGEELNFYGSLFCLTGCVLFIAAYTVMPLVTGRERWWASHIGRMLVTKATALAGLMLIVVLLYLFDLDLEWVRAVRGVFAALIGAMMMYQTGLVVRLQRDADEKEQRP
jgi:hypothetical protein